jgi:ArsR family transcriptional regulator, arsenate/arsenite/antimonite-responsive transcriptional repressor
MEMNSSLETPAALAGFSALAHESRLAIFRWLMQRHPAAQPAGAIADALGLAPATLSFHLAHLERAGLVDVRQVGRQRLCSPRLDTMQALIGFLVADCCHGEPAACADALAAVLPACASPPTAPHGARTRSRQ